MAAVTETCQTSVVVDAIDETLHFLADRVSR